MAKSGGNSDIALLSYYNEWLPCAGWGKETPYAPTSNVKITYLIIKKSSQNRLLIKGGKVVNDDRMFTADIYIEDGVIRYVVMYLNFV